MSDLPILWLILLQFVFIGFNAIFACAEIAVISMNENKLAKLVSEGDKRAIRLSKLTEQPSRFLSTIQVGITLVNLLSSAVATESFSERLAAFFRSLGLPLPASVIHALCVVIITLVLTYFTVLLGELIPKRLAMKKAEDIALGMSGFIYTVSRIFIPAVWLFSASTNAILRLLGVDPNSEEEENAEEEIRLLLDAGNQNGTILPAESSMIQNIFEFNDITAEDIMTHRTEVTLLWTDDDDASWEKTINDTRHSHYPVCDGSPDNIIGVLRAKDYLRLKQRTRSEVMRTAVHHAWFVPEGVRADVLFRNMQKSRNHFAIVLDEYGGVSGIITMNDLLEEIVGDLEDDISVPREAPMIVKCDKNSWRIQGTAPLEDVAEQLDLSLPVEEYDTFGGLVFALIGTVPSDGATPSVDGFGMHIQVECIKDHRMERALVQRLTQEEESPAPEPSNK